MAIDEEQRHRMIRRAVLHAPIALVDESVMLWEKLHLVLAAIIGDGGFASLYARNLHQTQTTFAWLTRHPPQAVQACLAQLRLDLGAQDLDVAGAASAALLVNFVDTLILLIGELLTTSVLREAWGGDVVNDAGTEAQ